MKQEKSGNVPTADQEVGCSWTPICPYLGLTLWPPERSRITGCDVSHLDCDALLEQPGLSETEDKGKNE